MLKLILELLFFTFYLEKGKLVVRRGRKATDLLSISGKTAELPGFYLQLGFFYSIGEKMLNKIHSEKGITLLEFIITTAIIGILVVSINTIFLKSHDSSQRVYHSQEALTSNLWGLYWITKDLRSASRHSVGSYILNGGFEKPSDGTTPLYWSSVVEGTGIYGYEQSRSTVTVKSGVRSIALSISKKGNPNTLVTYETANFIEITPNMAYMITGWVRNSTFGTIGRISLIDNSFNTVVSTETHADTWEPIQCRFPAAGLYINNMLSLNRVKIRLEVTRMKGSSNLTPVYFDDISVTPIHSVMASSNSSITVDSTASNPNNPAASVGFRFARWDNGSLNLYRYRIGAKNNENYIIREKFNETNSCWENTKIKDLACGIETLIFSYDINNQLPPKGKETPVTIISLLRDDNARKKNIHGTHDVLSINSLAP